MLRTTLTPDEAFVLQTIEDDDEEAPWMSVGDLQMWATSNLYIALRSYAWAHHPEWYVASMLPILFPRPGRRDKGKLSPDLFVALAEDHPRQSYDLTIEPNPPGLVVEVLSPDSVGRDVGAKVTAYSGLGVDEYVLFAPSGQLGQPPLQGYSRDRVTGAFVPVSARSDERGLPRLWSGVLGLWVVARGAEVRAQDQQGAWLPTYEEHALAREVAERELRRLRAELEKRDRG